MRGNASGKREAFLIDAGTPEHIKASHDALLPLFNVMGTASCHVPTHTHTKRNCVAARTFFEKNVVIFSRDGGSNSGEGKTIK